jgi:hypothetical protein
MDAAGGESEDETIVHGRAVAALGSSFSARR